MCSRTVRRPYPDVSPPETMLIRWRIGNGSVATSCPATRAWPDVGRRRVARILMRVVFPAPFGPKRPKSSPSRIWRGASSRGGARPPPPPPPAGRRQTERGSGRRSLAVSGDVPGDPVPHQDTPDVREFRDLALVVFEVLAELVRIRLRELDPAALDVGRPDVSQRFTPHSSSEGSVRREET